MDRNQFYSLPIRNKLPAEQLIEESHQIEMPYGQHEIKRWFFDGLEINHVRTDFKDYFHFDNINKSGVVNLSFNLQGDYEIHQWGQTYDVKQGQHNLIHSKGYSNTFYNKKLVGETFDIKFSPEAFYKIAKDGNDTLKQFLERMIKDEPVVLSTTSLFIHPDLYTAIRSILECSYSGEMKKLFLLSKSIEILVLQAETYDKYLKNKAVYTKYQSDQEQLQFAKAYVEQNIATPPSLSQLARKAGINEYKLKRGFKELFGTTVFGYLSNIRLEKAKTQLLQGNKTIGEIAFDLGYSSSQHFSKAFKKKFGITPSQCGTLN